MLFDILHCFFRPPSSPPFEKAFNYLIFAYPKMAGVSESIACSCIVFETRLSSSSCPGQIRNNGPNPTLSSSSSLGRSSLPTCLGLIHPSRLLRILEQRLGQLKIHSSSPPSTDSSIKKCVLCRMLETFFFYHDDRFCASGLAHFNFMPDTSYFPRIFRYLVAFSLFHSSAKYLTCFPFRCALLSCHFPRL